jgi:3-hydroxyacyl-[acyl-carrier-protein] dehydratase
MNHYRHRFEHVENYLHHRPPYLLVDKIQAIDEREIVTAKLVTEEDVFIAGHFPGAPIFPGAMMQEFITQSAGILIAANFNPMESYDTSDPSHNEYALGVLMKVNSARYRSFARPGDRLEANIRLNEIIENLFDFTGRITVRETEIMRIDFRLSNIRSALLNKPA